METKDPEAVAVQAEKKEPVKIKVTVGRIMSYYRPIGLTFLGVALSFIMSFSWPMYGLIYCKLLFIMMTNFLPTFTDDRNFWCGMFLLLVFAIGITNFLQKWIFQHAGENLTQDLRI